MKVCDYWPGEILMNHCKTINIVRFWLKIGLIAGLFLVASVKVAMAARQEKKEKEEKTGKIGEFEAAVKDPGNSGKDSTDVDEERSGFQAFLFLNDSQDLLFFPRLFVGPFPGEDSALYNGHYWQSSFANYPYFLAAEGLFSMGQRKSFSVMFNGHYFYNSSILQGIHFAGRLSPVPYGSFTFAYSDLTEKLRYRNDHLRLYDLFLNYYRIRTTRWVLWWGVGLKGMQGNDTYNGPGLNLGTEVYPVNPVSAYLNFNFGWLNGQAVTHFLIRGNVHLSRNIFYVGYQRFSAGSSALNGLVVGTGIYF